jgi:hypothetical protein
MPCSWLCSVYNTIFLSSSVFNFLKFYTKFNVIRRNCVKKTQKNLLAVQENPQSVDFLAKKTTRFWGSVRQLRCPKNRIFLKMQHCVQTSMEEKKKRTQIWLMFRWRNFLLWCIFGLKRTAILGWIILAGLDRILKGTFSQEN